MGHPRSSAWLAWACLNQWGLTGAWIPARRAAARTMRRTCEWLRAPPLRDRKTGEAESPSLPTLIRDFLAAGLVDNMHIVVVPIPLGRGVRLWDGLEGLEKNYQ